MLDKIKACKTNPTLTSEPKNKHARPIETIYSNNLDSDYTEKIEQLDKNLEASHFLTKHKYSN